MLWGAISYDTKSPLIVMKRDPQARNHGYSSWSYCKALEEGLLPIWPVKADGLFQHDNAPIHRAQRSKEWLQAHGVTMIPSWPPYSPDLNPIEPIWRILKARIRRLYPSLHLLMDNQEDFDLFVEVVQEAWALIPQQQIRGLINSIKRRLWAVIRARGWYTRY